MLCRTAPTKKRALLLRTPKKRLSVGDWSMLLWTGSYPLQSRQRSCTRNTLIQPISMSMKLITSPHPTELGKPAQGDSAAKFSIFAQGDLRACTYVHDLKIMPSARQELVHDLKIMPSRACTYSGYACDSRDMALWFFPARHNNFCWCLHVQVLWHGVA